MRGRRKAYKRKYQRYRRKYRRYKRANRTRTRIRRSSKKYVHVARQTQTLLIPWNDSGGNAKYEGLQFKLDDMLGSAQFVAMYQEYRINCVVVKFQPLWDSGDVANRMHVGTAGGVPAPQPINLPMIGWCYDYNDANTPTNLDDLQKFANYREAQFDKPIKIKIWPACAPGVYISGVAAGYSIKRKEWLRSANSNVPHYGLKYCVYNISNAVAYAWNFSVKYYVSFRGMW